MLEGAGDRAVAGLSSAEPLAGARLERFCVYPGERVGRGWSAFAIRHRSAKRVAPRCQ
jgi:hypothetical protein